MKVTFDKIYKKFDSLIFSILMNKIKDIDVCEDLHQQIFCDFSEAITESKLINENEIKDLLLKI